MATAQSFSKRRLGTYSGSLTQASKKKEITRQSINIQNRSRQTFSMVDRAGFEPATFRTLDLAFAKRTIFGPQGIPD